MICLRAIHVNHVRRGIRAGAVCIAQIKAVLHADRDIICRQTQHHVRHVVVIIIIVRVVHLMFHPAPRDAIPYCLGTIQPAAHQPPVPGKHNVPEQHIVPVG